MSDAAAGAAPETTPGTLPETVRARIATLQLPANASIFDTVATPPELPTQATDALTLPSYRTAPGDGGADARPMVVLQGVLGQGGMGVVHLGHQASLGRDVAVKRVRDDSVRDDAAEHLLREALITGALAHPNIVPVYDLARGEDSQPLLVMKRIEGRPWEEALRDRPSPDDALAWGDWVEQQLRVLMDVCDAVRFAHSRGVIHRDLKPENVMLGHFGEVLVVDWGVAVAVDEGLRGRFPLAVDCHHIAGTPAYMAPEQVRGVGAGLGTFTDVYLLGAILFEVLTGAPPHDAESVHASLFSAHESAPPTLPAWVPAPLADLCRTAMAASPSERFADVAALRAALTAYLSHRASIEITERALRDAAELAQTPPTTDPSGDGPVDPLGVHKRFTRCKFGFQQALDIWPANERARQGLQDVLCLMATRSLDAGEVGQAALLLEELPRPDATLQARLQDVRDAQAAQQRGLRQLGALGERHDVRVGRKQRRWFTVTLLVGWPALSLLDHTWQQSGQLSGARHTAVAAGVLLYALLHGLIKHRRIRSAGLNQRMFHVASLVLLGVFALRLFAWVGHLHPWHAQPGELLLFFLGQGAIAALTLRRLAYPSLIYGVGSAVVAIAPDAAFLISAAVHLLAMGLALVLLERGSVRKEAPPVHPTP